MLKTQIPRKERIYNLDFPSWSAVTAYLEGRSSRPAPKRRYRSAARWRALSPAYRKRLERAGITKNRYIAGVPLRAGRGHSKTEEHPGRGVPGPTRLSRYRGVDAMFIAWWNPESRYIRLTHRIHQPEDERPLRPRSMTQRLPLWEAWEEAVAYMEELEVWEREDIESYTLRSWNRRII